MKHFLKVCATAVLLACGTVLGQDTAPVYGTFPSVGPTFAGSVASNFTSVAAITLKADNGIAIILDLTCTDGATAVSQVGAKFDLSADGVLYTTTMPLTNSVTMNGTNRVVGYTLFPSTVLNHMRYIRLSQLVNANTNIITVNGIRYAYFKKIR